MLTEGARKYLEYRRETYVPKQIKDEDLPKLEKHDFVAIQDLEKSIERMIEDW